MYAVRSCIELNRMRCRSYHPNQEKVLHVENTQIYANILAGKFLSLNSNEFSILMNNVKTLAGIIKLSFSLARKAWWPGSSPGR